jgi:hypothetical protein
MKGLERWTRIRLEIDWRWMSRSGTRMKGFAKWTQIRLEIDWRWMSRNGTRMKGFERWTRIRLEIDWRWMSRSGTRMKGLEGWTRRPGNLPTRRSLICDTDEGIGEMDTGFLYRRYGKYKALSSSIYLCCLCCSTRQLTHSRLLVLPLQVTSKLFQQERIINPAGSGG